MGLLRTMGVASGSAIFLLSSGAVALAEDQPATVESDTGVSVEASAEAKVRMEAKRAETKAQIEAKRAEVKASVETKRAEVKTNMEAKRTEAKASVEVRRAETKAQIEAKRAEMKANMELKRAEAKQRLTEIRDKKKQERAVRLNEQFDRLNSKWTDHFVQVLDRYDGVLVKIQARADIAATNGKDVALATAAIASAEAAIETARAAVVAQAAKSYALDTSTTLAVDAATASGQEELVRGLKTAFQELHKSLFSNLTALRDGAMRDARGAVQAALQTLNQIPEVDDDESTSINN